MAQTPDKPSLPNSASAAHVNPPAKPVAPSTSTALPERKDFLPDTPAQPAAKTEKEIAEGRRPDPRDALAGAKALAGTGSVSNPAAAVPGLNPPVAERHEYRDTAKSPLPGWPTPIAPALPSAGEFQSHLSGWLAELKAELPPSTQQHPVDYLEANFDRLSLQLYRRLTQELKGGQDAR